MLTLLRTLSVGYFSQHRVRSVLVVLSIALGVAVLVATQALSQGLGAGIQHGVNPLADLADLLITNGQSGVPLDLAQQLRDARIQGVKDVRPYVIWHLTVVLGPDDRNPRTALLLGADRKRERQEGQLEPRHRLLPGIKVHRTYRPRLPEDLVRLLVAQPALVSDRLAAELDRYQPADSPLRLRNAGRVFEMTRVGTVDFSQSDLPLKDSLVVLMDVHSASAICFPEKPDHVQQLCVTLEQGADRSAVQADLERCLSTLNVRADVQTAEANQQMVSDVTAGLEIGLALGGACALVIGLFLVYNVLSVTVAERRHDIGILRSVGATRRQIAGLFVAEATVLGLIGSLLGLPLGWLLAWLACKPMANVISDLLVPIDSARIHISLGLMALAIISGALVANLAALIPALLAASEEPADAVRRVPLRHRLVFGVLQIFACAVLLIASVLTANLRQYLPPRSGMFVAVVCMVLAGLIITPLLALVIGRIVHPLFRYCLGLEGRLAADNLVRTPGRTGLVIAALAATSGLMVSTAGFLKSTREAIKDWVDDKIAADLFVSSGSAVTSGGGSLTMKDDMRASMESVPGVEVALPVRFNYVTYQSPVDQQGRIVFLIALDSQAFTHSRTERPLARSISRYPQLAKRGNVLVSRNFAALYHKKVGDTIRFPGPADSGKDIEATIVGVVTDYTWNRGTIIMDLDWFRQEFNDQQVDVFELFLTPGKDPGEVRKELMDRFGQKEFLFVLTGQDVNRELRQALQKIYGLAYAQQVVVGLVALLGVVSALFISVLQRRQHLGLMRAVGATRGQVLYSVLAEAVLMGAIGAVVGFGLGLLLEWYVLDVLILDEAGFLFSMRIPWLEAGVVTLAAVVLATLAGLWPAYHATRLRIPEAIAYE